MVYQTVGFFASVECDVPELSEDSRRNDEAGGTRTARIGGHGDLQRGEREQTTPPRDSQFFTVRMFSPCGLGDVCRCVLLCPPPRLVESFGNAAWDGAWLNLDRGCAFLSTMMSLLIALVCMGQTGADDTDVTDVTDVIDATEDEFTESDQLPPDAQLTPDEEATQQEAIAEQQGQVDSVAQFELPLAASGRWMDVDGYRAWQPDPSAVGSGFVPYQTNGHWEWTAAGWVFVSDFDWGWAAFHYGRWWQSPSYGWLWYPDLTWGPAWVSWRVGGGYAGWAPLWPRHVRWHPRWCFVPTQRLGDVAFHRYAMHGPRYGQAFHATARLPFRAHGPSIAGVQRWGGAVPMGSLNRGGFGHARAQPGWSGGFRSSPAAGGHRAAPPSFRVPPPSVPNSGGFRAPPPSSGGFRAPPPSVGGVHSAPPAFGGSHAPTPHGFGGVHGGAASQAGGVHFGGGGHGRH